MNPTEIEFAIRDLVARPYDADTFAFDLIAICNAPKATVTKLKNGQTNAARESGDVLWKKHLFFRSTTTGDVGSVADLLANDPLTIKHKPRFILVTNGVDVHIRDLKVDETCNVRFDCLDEETWFLLPLAGFERRAEVEEHPADVKAAKRLKKLHEAILSANPTWNAGHHVHELNLLMTRLLFCFYAEKTGIFDIPRVFTKTVTQYTSEDGSDVASLLDRLFRIMNVAEKDRPESTPSVDSKFPYVNGSLFEDTVEIPRFSRTARRQLLECGDLDWTTINPDIFGSMIQTIAQDGARSDLGMHYTSVPNIMKVLQPLLLDELHEAYEKAKESASKLEALLGRLSKIRVFDPACGSGNFLIISYKSLRQLEMRILSRIGEITTKPPLRLSGISLQHFYGIDIVDFACETAKLSLWIAEHQMNAAFKEAFGSARPTLPLAKITTIRCANATRLNWVELCPPDSDSEVYICGNPPYHGIKGLSPDQRADIVANVSPILKGDTKVDYVTCWLVKLADYICVAGRASGALVTTNSICQGEQVAFLWPHIFSKGLCITFAHTSFNWENNASHNAGVTCIVVGLGKESSGPRTLYGDTFQKRVSNINAYLVASEHNVTVSKQKEPSNGFPPLVKGNEPIDGGHLILSSSEREQILEAYPASAELMRRFYGPRDLLYDLKRYALWIPDERVDFAMSIPPIANHVCATQKWRKTGAAHAQRAASTPHRFAFIKQRDTEALVVPVVSSERRRYLPVGLLGRMDIASIALCVTFTPPPYLLAVLSSRMHCLWTATVGGRMRYDYQYSIGLIYNTFQIPHLSREQKATLAEYSRAILRSRAKHPGRTLAELYDPEEMPSDLLQAHQDNDAFIEEYVYARKFRDDAHRIEHLFDLYAKMRTSNDTPLLAVSSGKAGS